MRHATALAWLAMCLLAPLVARAAPVAAGDKASAVCVECHDDEDLPDMKGSAHAVATDPRTPGCISCHGPSPTHVKKPPDVKERPPPDRRFGSKGASPPAERNAACLTCHQKDPTRMLWRGSAHEAGDVACNTCHKVHTPRDAALSRATQVDSCTTCHKRERAQMQRPSHHPVPEGRMGCSDCHNVHGSAGPKLARRDSTNDTCFDCHAEKRGPFVHPHEPVVDDCANCHSPHGSNVAGLLKARAPVLCQQCHTPHVAGGVGALGGQPGAGVPVTGSGKNVVTMWQGRSCMNCHTQVHGSNNPSATSPTPHKLFR